MSGIPLRIVKTEHHISPAGTNMQSQLFNTFPNLIILWGDRRWRWGDFRLPLRVAIVCGGVCWLVSSVRCSSRSCHSDRRRPRYSYSGCSGSVGCCHSVRRHRSLMNCVTGHRGGMCVCYPGSWLLTGRGKTQKDRSTVNWPLTTRLSLLVHTQLEESHFKTNIIKCSSQWITLTPTAPWTGVSDSITQEPKFI